MAKKKKDAELTYLQMPLPQGQSCYRFIINWNGLNKRRELDTGALSAEMNMSTDEAPYLVPSQKAEEYVNARHLGWLADTDSVPYEPYPYDVPISIHGFEDTLIVIYASNNNKYTDAYLDYFALNSSAGNSVITAVLNESPEPTPRCIAQFNTYDNILNPLDSAVYPRLIILPDKKSMPLSVRYYGPLSSNSNVPSSSLADAKWAGSVLYGTTPNSTEGAEEYLFFECVSDGSGNYNWQQLTYSTGDGNAADTRKKFFEPSSLVITPDMDYAVAFQSRLFGVGDGRVFASGYNDHTNWELDTIDEYNEANAWCSPAQANTKAGKEFTGITSYQNHVVCFKKDFVHEVYNTKNPFRIQDVYSEGAIDNRTIQEVNGNLIFVSENNVLVYTGGTPKVMGYNLNIDRFSYAAAGSDDRRYYLYCEDETETGRFFVYDSYTGTWSERSVDIVPNKGCKRVIGFAHNNRGMFMLGGDGYVYRLDTGNYDDTDWSFETELATRQSLSSSTSTAYTTVNVKHIKKLQMLTEIREGAWIRLYALYDGEEFDENISQLVYDSKGRNGRVPIRVKLRKSAHYSVKLHAAGHGYVKIYELELYVEKGGDLYV